MHEKKPDSRPKPHANRTLERVQEKLGTKSTAAGAAALTALGVLAGGALVSQFSEDHNFAEQKRLTIELEKKEAEAAKQKKEYDEAQKAADIARAALQKYLEDLKKKYEQKHGSGKPKP